VSFLQNFYWYRFIYLKVVTGNLKVLHHHHNRLNGTNVVLMATVLSFLIDGRELRTKAGGSPNSLPFITTVIKMGQVLV